MPGITLKKRSNDERARYLIGKYLSGEITLLNLKIQLNLIPDESNQDLTSTG